MERKLKLITVEELYNLYQSDNIDFGFECIAGVKSQRDFVWDTKDSVSFIDSILRNYSVSSCCKTTINKKMSIMDGQQRIKSLMFFIDNKFALSRQSENVNDLEIKGCKFKDLDQSLQKRIFEREIIFEDIVADLSNEEEVLELIEMFVRLNKGKNLTNMEVFRASLAENIKFLNEVVKHDFFKKINPSNNKRFKHEEIALNLLMLETNSTSGLSKPEKERFIEISKQYKEFSPKITNGLISKIDYLNTAFDREAYLSLKTGERYLKTTHIAQLFLLSKHAMTNHISTDQFFNWVQDFFYTNKDKKHDYFLSAVGDSTSSKSKLQMKYKILLKTFNKAFKIK